MLTADTVMKPPYTRAVRRALQSVNNSQVEADLLFLEAWEMYPSSHLGMAHRASQIRRANPTLAAALDEELRAMRRPVAASSGGGRTEASIPALFTDRGYHAQPDDGGA